jgi:hypothetical protein
LVRFEVNDQQDPMSTDLVGNQQLPIPSAKRGRIFRQHMRDVVNVVRACHTDICVLSVKRLQRRKRIDD